jgi:hypothetical protein
MYEHHAEPLLSWKQFASRLARHGGIAGSVLLFSLAIGTIGFHWLALQEWIDAFLNSSMLLGGMGPIGDIRSDAGKIFASLYALYAGIVFIGTSGLVLAPVLHRILHKIHLEEKHQHKS